MCLSSRPNSAAATTANAASSRKKAGWPTDDQSIPTTPASRLPLKIARNHDATVVAPRRGGASFANSPRPVGRMYSSPKVRIKKNATSHAQPTRVSPRSEEHRSELQSRMRISYDVLCLKKQHTNAL